MKNDRILDWCRSSVACILKEFVNRWEERLSRISIYKNDRLLTHHTLTLTVRPHLKVLYRFWRDTNDATGRKNTYINCSNKEPEEIKPKDQGFDEATEKIVDTSDTVSRTGGLDISFENMFQAKYKIIMIVITVIVTVVIAINVLIIFLY
jgi:hypothetical protein